MRNFSMSVAVVQEAISEAVLAQPTQKLECRSIRQMPMKGLAIIQSPYCRSRVVFQPQESAPLF
jgi:hypothetical protein